MSSPTPLPGQATASLPPPDPSPAAPAQVHWRANRRLVAGLLVLWAGVTFGVAFFARDLQQVFFGWPFAFWVAAQGAPLLYVLMVGFYAWRMGRLDDALSGAQGREGADR